MWMLLIGIAGLGLTLAATAYASSWWRRTRQWPSTDAWSQDRWRDRRFDDHTFSASDGESIDPDWWIDE